MERIDTPEWKQQMAGSPFETTEKLWDFALAHFRYMFTYVAADQWLAGSRLVDDGGGTVTVHLASDAAVDWVSHHWHVPVQRLLRGLLGREVAVCYES